MPRAANQFGGIPRALRAQGPWLERLHGQRLKSRRQARDETLAWLFWYNRERLHSTLAYVSPMQYEQNWLANQPRQASS